MGQYLFFISKNCTCVVLIDIGIVLYVQVGVLDIDICGPSIPKVMGVEGEQVHQSGSGWSPVVSELVHTHTLFS